MRFIDFLLIISVSATSQKPFKWPGNKKAAIVLTYDDALQSQLNIVIPQLDSFQLKGTFFVTGNFTEKDIVRWRNASKDGHELGNHIFIIPVAVLLSHPLAVINLKTIMRRSYYVKSQY